MRLAQFYTAIFSKQHLVWYIEKQLFAYFYKFRFKLKQFLVIDLTSGRPRFLFTIHPVIISNNDSVSSATSVSSPITRISPPSRPFSNGSSTFTISSRFFSHTPGQKLFRYPSAVFHANSPFGLLFPFTPITNSGLDSLDIY